MLDETVMTEMYVETRDTMPPVSLSMGFSSNFLKQIGPPRMIFLSVPGHYMTTQQHESPSSLDSGLARIGLRRSIAVEAAMSQVGDVDLLADLCYLIRPLDIQLLEPKTYM